MSSEGISPALNSGQISSIMRRSNEGFTGGGGGGELNLGSYNDLFGGRKSNTLSDGLLSNGIGAKEGSITGALDNPQGFLRMVSPGTMGSILPDVKFSPNTDLSPPTPFDPETKMAGLFGAGKER